MNENECKDLLSQFRDERFVINEDELYANFHEHTLEATIAKANKEQQELREKEREFYYWDDSDSLTLPQVKRGVRG